jgi:Na+-transporting NADH:ubiquinone oxidoreductase subunit NqrF
MSTVNVGWLRSFILKEVQQIITAGSNITLTIGDNTITITSSGGGGGGLDCATCDGDDLHVTGDLVVTGSSMTIRNGSNTVQFGVNSSGRLDITPSVPSENIRFNASIEDATGDAIVSANDAQSTWLKDFYS